MSPKEEEEYAADHGTLCALHVPVAAHVWCSFKLLYFLKKKYGARWETLALLHQSRCYGIVLVGRGLLFPAHPVPTDHIRGLV